MRAILIDPESQTITTLEYAGSYQDIYKLIGANTFDVRPIMGPGESIFFDDEFLLKMKEGGDAKAFFILPGLDPIAGKGLILGVNGGGESISTKVTVDWVKANIKFETLQLTGWTPGSRKEVEHPVYGKLTQIVGPRPIFDKAASIKPFNSIEDAATFEQHRVKDAGYLKQKIGPENRFKEFERVWANLLRSRKN
jgi:hypothetical protein